MNPISRILIILIIVLGAVGTKRVFAQTATPDPNYQNGLWYYREIQDINLTMPNVTTWDVRYDLITTQTEFCHPEDRLWGFGFWGNWELHKASPFSTWAIDIRGQFSNNRTFGTGW